MNILEVLPILLDKILRELVSNLAGVKTCEVNGEAGTDTTWKQIAFRLHDREWSDLLAGKPLPKVLQSSLKSLSEAIRSSVGSGVAAFYPYPLPEGYGVKSIRATDEATGVTLALEVTREHMQVRYCLIAVWRIQ